MCQLFQIPSFAPLQPLEPVGGYLRVTLNNRELPRKVVLALELRTMEGEETNRAEAQAPGSFMAVLPAVVRLTRFNAKGTKDAKGERNLLP